MEGGRRPSYFQLLGDVGYVRHVAVAPDHRRIGIGQIDGGVTLMRRVRGFGASA